MSHKTVEEIRKRFEYMQVAWREIREQGDINALYAAGEIWTPQERAERAGRPCMTFDLFSSYTNKIINNIRMNPLGVEAFPRGFGANDKTAANTTDKIREIQYDSQANGARITAVENAVQRWGGFYRISIQYRKGTFDREIVLRRIPNINQVLIDPDFREVNATDMKDFFIFEEWDKGRFRRMFKDIQIRDFAEASRMSNAKYFAKPDSVLVAEYWCKEEYPDILHLATINGKDELIYDQDIKAAGLRVQNGALVSADDGREIGEVRASRPEPREKIYQYWTNGFDILGEPLEWEGSYLPLVCVFGREMWVPEGSGDKRRIYSAIQLSRDAAKLNAYAKSTEVEVTSMVPKAPWVAAKGQISGNKSDWEDAHRRPVAWLEYDPMPDYLPAGAILPPPMRQTYEPAIQAFMMQAEGAKRAVMDGMGIETLPTGAQTASDKSGIALKRIDQQQTIGAYHFTDAYKAAIQHEGRILVDLIKKVYAPGQTTAIRRRDEKHESMQIEEGAFAGEHDVTIKAGPNQESEREAAAEFASQIATPELMGLAINDNPKASKIVSLAIRLQNGGPGMDAIADIFDPQKDENQGDPKEQLARMQMQAQQMEQALKAMNAHAAKLEQDLAVERGKNETTLAVASMNNATKLELEKMRLGIETQKLELERLTTIMANAMKAASDQVKYTAAQTQQPGDVVNTQQDVAI